MPLSDDQLTLIRQSFDVLRHDMAPASTYFYDDLFTRAPELRELFRDDLAGQGMKFLSTLAVIVDNLHKPEDLAERYADLGGLHRTLGVTGKMFAPMGEALLATIKESLGERYTIEIEAAWRVAYQDMAAALIERGGIPEG
ncbi:MAG: globin domain-containing protein [Rhodobacter sp.]|nr:globin domain-containing protein [Rhodobacter sp.]